MPLPCAFRLGVSESCAFRPQSWTVSELKSGRSRDMAVRQAWFGAEEIVAIGIETNHSRTCGSLTRLECPSTRDTAGFLRFPDTGRTRGLWPALCSTGGWFDPGNGHCATAPIDLSGRGPSMPDTDASSCLPDTGSTTAVWPLPTLARRSGLKCATRNTGGSLRFPKTGRAPLAISLSGRAASTPDTDGSSCLSNTGWRSGVSAAHCSSGR